MGRVTSLALGAIALTSGADAFWRMPCRGRVAMGRIDPIVDPGKAAAHAHTVHGGSGIDLTSSSTELHGNSHCTSCQIGQDKSAYWSPLLYFQHSSGEYELVQQDGGMLAYYFLNNEVGEKITAFPKGFRMLAGDTNRRNFTCQVPEPPKSLWTGHEASQDGLSQKAVGFNCLDYSSKPEDSLYRHFLPKKDYLDANCKDGVRFEMMFGQCWNGKDLDSPDHRSHIAYPAQVISGECPTGFETRLPGLFFETIWRTDLFKGKDGQFVIANGDVSGYGYHADFMEGWDDGFLQQAVETCTSLSGVVEDCPLFDVVSEDDMQTCAAPPMPMIAHEDCAAPGNSLPGGVQIAYGPQPAGMDDNTGSFDPVGSVASAISNYLPKAAPSMGASAKFSGNYNAAPASAAKQAAAPSVAASYAAQAPAPSAAAVEAQAVPSQDSACASMKMVTKGAEAWQICVEEAVVTVTADADAAAPTGDYVKRHLANHAHRHGH